MDYTPLLRKYQYQIACKSPQSAKSSSKDDNADDSITYGPDEVGFIFSPFVVLL